MTKRTLAYTKVVDYLTEGIANGTFPEGEMVPSEASLAKALGVSTGTAKFAVGKLTASGLLKRVPRVGTFVVPQSGDAPRVQGYGGRGVQPNRDLAPRGSVFLVVPCLPDSYLTTIVQGVEREARSNGIDVILRITDHDESIEQEVLMDILGGARADGVIIFPVAGSACPDGLLRMKLEGYPAVVLDREYSGVRLDAVVPDHYNGAMLAVEHLLSLGHRRIGFVSTDISACSASRARYNGFLAALAKSEAMVGEGMVLAAGELVMPVPGVTTGMVGRLEAFMKANPAMTAICAVNDYLAAAAVQAALNLGMPVPQGMAVTGFSNNEVGRNAAVPVTTVDHSAEAMGGAAMDLLLKRINDPGRSPERVVMPATLIGRRSTLIRSGC